MRFTIKHGAEIETATPADVARIVAEQFDARTVHDYTRRKNNIQLDANGAALQFPGGSGGSGSSQYAGYCGNEKVSSEFAWRCERVTIAGNGAANALVQLYENQISPLDLLEVIQVGATGVYSDAFSNTLYVPANSQLIIAVSGGVANENVSYNLQIRQLPRR